MTRDKFVQARRKKEAYQGTPTANNTGCADLDKSNAEVINGQFLTIKNSIICPKCETIIKMKKKFFIYILFFGIIMQNMLWCIYTLRRHWQLSGIQDFKIEIFPGYKIFRL